MRKAAIVTITIFLILTRGGSHLVAQPIVDPGEFGDAPEGAIAYPSLGVGGLFPTCKLGPAGVVFHFNLVPQAWFGQTMDIELDGNAGNCPQPPYEMDECWAALDNDAGLVNTTTYTIFQNQVTPCGGLAPDPVGPACTMIQWGAAIDIRVTNQSGSDAVINVLFDWNQDGVWNGQSLCLPGGPAPEQVVWNLPIPHGFSGLLSGLNPPAFLTGPNEGFVWVRFTISNLVPMIPIDWDGSGQFDTGETEDYLLEIGPDAPIGGSEELGDAPEQALAYPNGVLGNFPTCIATLPAGFILHKGPSAVHFGPSLDFELDGNQDLCNFSIYDHDECDTSDGDAGLIMPAPFTLDPNGILQTCPNGSTLALGVPCQLLQWGVDIDIQIENNAGDRLLNVLADWDGSGEWNGPVTCAPGITGLEQVLLNFPIPGGFSGPLSLLLPPNFTLLSNESYVWFRFSLCDTLVASNWDGSGTFGDGETEDYLLAIDTPTDAPSPENFGQRLRLEPAYPNPFNPSVRIVYLMREPGPVHVTIHDVTGALVTTLDTGEKEAGRHELVWRGTDERGKQQSPGIYLVRVVSSDDIKSQKIVMLK